MPASHRIRAVVLLVALAITTAAAQGRPPKADLKRPLVIASQGSFFVGGDTRPLSGAGAAGDVTVNQMYVQYQAPPDAGRFVPLVMVHGCCLSSKTWETTPDGRMGWDEYFVRLGRAVYLADQVSRGRSGFDASVFNAVRAGNQPPGQLPNILFASRQVAWTVFRFGPKFGTSFPDGQFPVEAADELYKQMIPDLNALLPAPNPTWANMAALATRIKGAILMGHSESGFFPERAALIDAAGIRGMISIEQQCPADLTDKEIVALARIPTLMVFGDHLGDVTGGPANWQASFDGCQGYVKRVVAAGGDAEMMHLPALGIRGNSHMLMQDRNNLQVADLIAAWIESHVERKGKR